MVLESRETSETHHGAIQRTANQLGYSASSIRRWVADAETPATSVDGTANTEPAEGPDQNSAIDEPAGQTYAVTTTSADTIDTDSAIEESVTLYDLTQAIIRYKVLVIVGASLILLLVLGMSFTIENGSLAPRGDAKYESGVQISVVAPGTESLSSPEPSDSLSAVASGYADLLSSGEAADAIGQMSGYSLPDPLTATVGGGDVPLISTSVVGPTSDLAQAAALNAFEWLSQKIQQPLNPQPAVEPVPIVEVPVELDGPFSASVTVEIDASLVSVPGELLVLVDTSRGIPIAVPVSEQAGGAVEAVATLEPSTSIRLLLEARDGTRLDVLRLVLEQLPSSAPGFPSLTIALAANAIHGVGVDDEATWVFDSSAVTTNWIPGVPETEEATTESQQFQIALITAEPSSFQIGGRRGPLLGFAVLLIGFIGLLSIVVVVDTWRRQRHEDETSEAEPVVMSGGQTGVPAEIQVATETEVALHVSLDAGDSTHADR